MSHLPRPTSAISSGSSSLSREASSVTSGGITGTRNKLTKIKTGSLGPNLTSATGNTSDDFNTGDKVFKITFMLPLFSPI